MNKVGFCAIAGSGMSALAQVLKFKNYEVLGSDRSFDQQKDLKNKQRLQELGIKIYPQDGSMVDSTLSALYASTAVEDTIPDIKQAKTLLCLFKSYSSAFVSKQKSVLQICNYFIIKGAYISRNINQKRAFLFYLQKQHHNTSFQVQLSHPSQAQLVQKNKTNNKSKYLIPLLLV